MKMKYYLICLISELLCIQYLPKDRIINLPSNSDSGVIFLNSTDFPHNYCIYLFFRVNNGKINSRLSYSISDKIPVSEEQFPYENQLDYYKIENDNKTTIYIYQLNSLDKNKYYIIKYSGFSGKSINVACSLYNVKAKYIPRDSIIKLSNTEKFGYIYLKFDDFSDSNDIYIYFKVSNGNMKTNIQYQETNVNPGYIISFSSPKEKESNYLNNNYEINSYYIYNFSKNNYKYLIIYYSLNYMSNITVSSSIQIQYLSRNKIFNLNTNYEYDYIYLNYKEFQSIDNIYVYFQIFEGTMNSCIEYQYSYETPVYKEMLSSFENKNCYEIDKFNDSNNYVFEFPTNISNYNYLIIKYSGFSGKSISVISSAKIKYLSKDKRIFISNINHKLGYLYLNYNDFSSLDNNSNIYLYFKIYNGEMNDYLYYTNTNAEPIYESQFPSMISKKSEKKDIINNPRRYVYKFEKESGYKYLVIKYSGITQGILSIYSLSINPMAYFISKDKSITLTSSSKVGFIYVLYSDFSEKDDIYIYLEFDGVINSNISYINTDVDPSIGDYYASMENKNFDNSNEKSENKIYCYKFNKINYNYLLIKYSGFKGNNLKISCSNKDPFNNKFKNILIIILIIIGIIICISLILFFIYKCRVKNKKKKEKLNEVSEDTHAILNNNNSINAD